MEPAVISIIAPGRRQRENVLNLLCDRTARTLSDGRVVNFPNWNYLSGGAREEGFICV